MDLLRVIIWCYTSRKVCTGYLGAICIVPFVPMKIHSLYNQHVLPLESEKNFWKDITLKSLVGLWIRAQMT